MFYDIASALLIGAACGFVFLMLAACSIVVGLLALGFLHVLRELD